MSYKILHELFKIIVEIYAPFVNIATSTPSNTFATTANLPTSTNSHPSIHMPSSYYQLGISDKLLCEL